MFNKEEIELWINSYEFIDKINPFTTFFYSILFAVICSIASYFLLTQYGFDIISSLSISIVCFLQLLFFTITIVSIPKIIKRVELFFIENEKIMFFIQAFNSIKFRLGYSFIFLIFLAILIPLIVYEMIWWKSLLISTFVEIILIAVWHKFLEFFFKTKTEEFNAKFGNINSNS